MWGELKMPSRWKQDFPVPSGEDSYVTRTGVHKVPRLDLSGIPHRNVRRRWAKAGEAVLSATSGDRSRWQTFTRFRLADTSSSAIRRKTIPAFCCVLPKTSSWPSISDARICPARCSSTLRRNSSRAPVTKDSSARKTDVLLPVRRNARSGAAFGDDRERAGAGPRKAGGNGMSPGIQDAIA